MSSPQEILLIDTIRAFRIELQSQAVLFFIIIQLIYMLRN